MNHLAHFHLAGDCELRIVGALLADHLRGAVDAGLAPQLGAGVRLHRRIDAFTDAHPRLRELRARFPGAERRLSGVVLDLHLDRALARHWHRFHPTTLADYSARVYGVLERHAAKLPPAGRLHASRMREYDLLQRYADVEVLSGALTRIGTRLGMSEAMRAADRRARDLGNEIEAGFLDFYPQAIEVARRFIAG
jgi:acyl carrier protein phosphodiesterase